jgi:aspartate aminotransferase
MSGGPRLARAVARLGTESAFTVLAQARALERTGTDVVHLEIGEPDFPTPAHVVEAAVEAMRRGETGYCPANGILECREACAQYLGAPRGLTIDPDDVLVATGAKPFLFFTVLACVEPGDEVIYPDPGFPIYRSAVEFAGGVPVPLPLRRERGFALDVDELAALITDRTRLVILNSPNNPTGAVIGDADLDGVAAVLERSGAWVLSDEVYAKITYEGPVASVASRPGLLERTVLVDGCSKTFAMTGWRCGFAAVPAALREPLTRFFVNSTSCVPPFVQRAAIAALTGPMDAVNEMVETFRRRRDLIVPALNQLAGVSCTTPTGAFYAFADVSRTGVGADLFATRLLAEHGVALLAGSAFGAHATDHVRVSFAASAERLQEGVSRIHGFLADQASLSSR